MGHDLQIRKRLKANGLDALLITGEANRLYVSSFPTPGDDAVVLLTEDALYYLTDFRYIEAARKAVCGQVEMVSRGRGYVTLLNEIIDAKGLHNIGFEEEYIGYAQHRLYAEKLHAVLHPATALLCEARERKDAAEIEKMIAAQRIAERAFTELLNDVRVGVTERELAARLIYLTLCFGGEGVSFDPIVASGENGSVPHAVPGDRVLRAGDFVTFDFGAKYEGYCSDTTRTVALGSVTDEMAQVYEIVREAQRRGIAAAKAGVSGEAIDAAARDYIAACGYGDAFGHAFGHSLGIEVHEAPNATPNNKCPLPCGAVISAEPGIYLEGKFGVRIEDVLILQEDDNTDITELPRELQIL